MFTAAETSRKCSNCGNTVHEEARFCTNCGQRVIVIDADPSRKVAPETESTTMKAAKPARAVVRFSRPPSEIVPVVAEAYRQAALAEADMVEAARSLERMREILLAEDALFPLLDRIDNHVGLNWGRSFLTVLLDLRRWVREAATADLIEELRAAFDRDPARGREKWLQAYAESIVWWRSQTCLALVKANLPLPPAPVDFAKATRLLQHERWAELYPLYTYLAGESILDPYVRAQLLATSAQIQLYYLRSHEALPLLEQARELSSNHAEVLAARARYHLEQFEYERAAQILERVRALDSSLIYGYTFTGDLYEQQNNLEDAEHWYLKAISELPGHADGFTRLIGLYGRPELIEDEGSEIPRLVQRITTLFPDEEYNAYAAAGYAYRKAKRYQEAHEWFERAIKTDPTRLEGYLAQGDTYVEEGAFVEAPAAYAQAIDVAPEAMDGYWGMAWHFENQEKWEEAIAYYEEAKARRPQWEAKCLAKAGYLQWKLGRADAALERFVAALESDPADDLPHSYLREVVAEVASSEREQAAHLLAKMEDVYLAALPGQSHPEIVLKYLYNVATDYFRLLDDEGSAEHLYERITDVQGPAAGAAGYSKLGNLHYDAANYSAAARAYRQAAKLDPEEASYQSNLGFAYRQQGLWQESDAAFSRAIELDPQGTHQIELARNYNERANDAYRARDYRAAVEGFNTAVTLNPDDPIFYYNLARSWQMLVPAEGKPAMDQAVTALQQACDRAPDRKDYSDLLQTLKAHQRLSQSVGAFALTNRPMAARILIEVSPALASLVWADRARSEYREAVQRDSRGISSWYLETYGFALPPINFAVREDLDGGQYVINVRGSARVSGELEPGKQLFLGGERALEEAGIVWESARNPFNGNTAYLIDVANADQIRSQRNFLWSPVGLAVLHLGGYLRSREAEFIDHRTVHARLMAQESDLCRQILGSTVHLTAFTLVLRALIDEFVPIKELEVIAGAFLDRWQPGNGLMAVVRDIRCQDAIRPFLYGNQEDCDLLWLGTDFEKMLAERIVYGDREPYLAIEPEETQQALQIIREAVAPLTGAVAVAVDQRETRPFVRKLIELEFPYLAVIARDELLSGHESRSLGSVAWEGSET